MKKKIILTPDPGCPWNIQRIIEHLFWERGCCKDKKGDFRAKYAICALEDVPVVTVGLKSDPDMIGYDYLYIRAGGLNAYNLSLDTDNLILVFLDREGYSTRAMMSTIKWEKTEEEFNQLFMWMEREARPKSVAEARDVIKKNMNRDWKSCIPIPQWRQHKFVYKGLKLGQYLGDWSPADEDILSEFEHSTGYKLPEDYREFILTTNGGHLKNKVYFKAKGLPIPKQIDRFIRFDKKGGLGRLPDEYKYGPKWVLPIGDDGGTQRLFLGLQESIKGHVFAVGNSEGFYHSDITLDQMLKLKGMRLLAISFTEFLENLIITDELI